ncbi:transposase [Caballeronia novacaledonica]
MRLQAHGFVRRSLLHVLPLALQRIRHYRLL